MSRIKMISITLAGLCDDPNLGDAVIHRCTSYLVERAMSDKGLPYRLTDVDIRGEQDYVDKCRERIKAIDADIARERQRKAAPVKSFPFLNRVRAGIARRVNKKRLAKAKQAYADSILLVSRKAAKRSINQATDCVVFVGGGLIKYKYQKLPQFVEVFIERAEQCSVPVMLCSVGVEGYDSSNDECMKLVRLLNTACVNTVTTRDDIELLRKHYIDGSKDIRTALTADSALWSREVFGVTRAEDSDVVGIGVARPKLFPDNGIDVSEDKLLQKWSGLVKEIESRGRRWQLFSNGLPSDQAFAERLLEYMGLSHNAEQLIAPRPTTSDELVALIGGYRSIIACRLHSAIIAASLDIPAVELIWNSKQTMFAQLIGCIENYITLDNFTPAHVADRLESAESIGYDTQLIERLKSGTRDEVASFIDRAVIT